MTKIIKDSEIANIKQEGIVLVGGCFDILHPAHLEFLTLSKKQGNKLVVLLESDENIKKLKGDNRPMNNQIIRANNLSKLDFVDHIVILTFPASSQYYYNLVKILEPAIIAVTEGDAYISDKKKQAKLIEGKVVEVMKRDRNFSTSKLIDEKVE